MQNTPTAVPNATAFPPISMVVPTRNRAHTLQLVARSYFEQDGVDQIVIIDDDGHDDTRAVLTAIALDFPNVELLVLRNQTRQGASASRNIGVAAVRNDYVLFCDDDEMLQPGYACICQQKLMAAGAGAVSGRRVYMRDGESPEGALCRFGDGIRPGAPYLPLLCEHVAGARYQGDVRMPFTTAVILTRTDLVKKFRFDDFYAKGNGYREESDFQMNLYVNGYDIIQTNDIHSIHLSPAQVRTGGQRVKRWHRVYWSVFYTRYFYRKYWAGYAARAGLRLPRPLALAYFAVFSIYREYIRPTLRSIAFNVIGLGNAGYKHTNA